MNKEEKETRQTTLFGGYVEQVEQAQELVFVKVYEEVANDGDQFTMTPSTATYNRTKHCLTLVDTDKSQALTVWFENHANARFKTTPEGVRLGRAVEKAFKTNISDYEELAACFLNHTLELHITMNGDKGRLWTITVQE